MAVSASAFAGVLRDDVPFPDIEFLLGFLAGVKLGDASRSAELRRGHLSVIIAGRRRPLPSDAPTREDQRKLDRAVERVRSRS